VYRNLAILETAGVVTRVVSNDEFGRFELAEDLIGHHHHLMCESCGAMSDITIPHEIEEQLDSTLGALAKASGFTLSHHRLDRVGKCAKCA
jgi:Fe2+ or Zn2+ uptake regulation protein